MPLDIIRRAKDYSPLAHVSHGKKQLLSGILNGIFNRNFSSFQSQKDEVAYRCVAVIVNGPGSAGKDQTTLPSSRREISHKEATGLVTGLSHRLADSSGFVETAYANLPRRRGYSSFG